VLRLQTPLLRRANHLANGEGDRDGHGSEPSWHNGVEGPSDYEALLPRARDLRALLGTLFAIMLALGDEFGRTQGGNNNACAQDNRLAWLDWEGRNLDLEAHLASATSTPADSEQAVLIADASRAPRCLRVRRAIRR
jgi:glycogen operon protein